MKQFLIILLTVLAVNSYAQNTGAIKGKVTDSKTGEMLKGAVVRVVGTNFGTQVNEDGIYFIKNLAPGTYSLQVSYIGYQSTTIKGIKLRGNETTVKDLAIIPLSSQLFEAAKSRYIKSADRYGCSPLIKTGEYIKSIPTRDLQLKSSFISKVKTDFLDWPDLNCFIVFLPTYEPEQNPFRTFQKTGINYGVSYNATEEVAINTNNYNLSEYTNLEISNPENMLRPVKFVCGRNHNFLFEQLIQP